MTKKLFTAKVNKPLLAQYVRVYLANQRRGTASAKTRGEVSGGGRKPWRQKGTGRARHGSIRSPIWVGGGVAHGPKPKDWGLKMPSKMRRKALLSALALAEGESRIHVLSTPAFDKISTKKMRQFLETQGFEGRTLMVFNNFESKRSQNMFLSARNIKELTLRRVGDINPYEVLRAKQIVFFGKAEQKVRGL